MILMPVIKGTLVGHGMQCQNSYLKYYQNTCNRVPIEGKSLDDEVVAAIDYFSENKEEKGIDR